MIYDNSLFNETPLNRIIRDKNINSYNIETTFGQLHKGEKLANEDNKNISGEINTNINDNLKEIKQFRNRRKYKTINLNINSDQACFKSHLM